VLFEQGQGMPASGWRMCLTVRSMAVVTMALAQVPSSGAMGMTWLSIARLVWRWVQDQTLALGAIFRR